MIVVATLVALVALIAIIWYLIRWIIGKAEQKPIFRKRFFISIVVFVACIVGLGVLGSYENETEMSRLELASAQDYRDAKKENTSDPTQWAELTAQRESEEKQRIAEKKRRIAEAERERAARERERAAIERAKSDFFRQPDQQLGFVAAIEKARDAMRKAANDLAKGGIRRKRLNDVCAVVANGRIRRWSGILTELTTNGDGLGVVTIEVGDRIWFKTWNNALSDIVHGTMIDPGSPLFSKLAMLKEGDSVVFDARLIPTPEGPDCYFESSLTFNGAMRSPEFIAKFERINTFLEN